MTLLNYILASVGIALGVFGTLALFTLCIAGSPNSSDEQLRMIKLYMIASLVGGLVCVVGGTVFVVRGSTLVGGTLGILPMAVLFGLIAWVSIRA